MMPNTESKVAVNGAGHVARRPREAVVLLTSQLAMGGAERHAITLANLLCREFQVVMAYLKPEEQMLGQVNSESLSALRCLHIEKRIDMRAIRELVELCQVHHAKVIVCANAFALMYAQLTRWLSPEPLVVVEIFHTTKLRTLKEHLELLFYRPFFWAAHHLVFVCEGQRQYWRRRGLCAKQTHMISNGVGHARAALGFGADDRVVGICAVLRPEKAHADLLAAVARCAHQGRPWKVLIIGDGPMRESIERMTLKLGLQESVRITGFQADVRQLLAACDIVALVSTAIETFSIAALEAMAMEKPIIMSNIGGAREQIEHGVNGLLFPAGDVNALAACLRECWDPARTRQMGQAARRRVESEFSLAAMSDGYVALMRGILGARGEVASA